MAHLRDKYQATTITVKSPWITLNVVNTLTTVRFAEIDLLRKVSGLGFQDRNHLIFSVSVIPTQNLRISPTERVCVSLYTNSKDRLFP